jgi:hypothetical protein
VECVDGLVTRITRARARREADRWLRAADGHWHSSSAFAWRIAELTSERERRLLAHSLRGIVRDVEPDRLPGASPLNRVGLRAHVDLLTAIAGRLADLDQPVAPAGVLLVRDLLTDGGSPLYTEGRIGQLPSTVAGILAALEPW